MIETRRLTKQFAGTMALDGVTLSVPLGETVVVLGPSGCGKTTLLRLIAGLEQADSGEIRINGTSVASCGARVDPRTRQVGMIFQDLALWPHMRALENVCFGLVSGWRKRRTAVQHGLTALRWVALERYKHRYPHQLSGGERQRLAIARALAPGNPYLLMDEPFSSLDPILRDEMITLIRRLRQALGTTIIYVTHNLDEALTLADRILLMKQGRIVEELLSGMLRDMSREGLCQWYKDRSRS